MDESTCDIVKSEHKIKKEKKKKHLDESLKEDIQTIKDRRDKKKKIDEMVSWSKPKSKNNSKKKEEFPDEKVTKKKTTEKKRPRLVTKEKASKKSKSEINDVFSSLVDSNGQVFTEKIKNERKSETIDIYKPPLSNTREDSFDNRKSLSDFITKFKPSNVPTSNIQTNVIRDMNQSIQKKIAKPNLSAKQKEIAEIKEDFIKRNDLEEIILGLKPQQHSLFMKIVEEEKKKEDDYLRIGRSYLKKKIIKSPELEKCGLDYCKDHLREPSPANDLERPCRMGNYCICVLLAIQHPDNLEETKAEDGFIAREFLLPSVRNHSIMIGKPPEEEEYCLLDLRLRTTYTYYQCIFDSFEPKELLQNHYNTVNEADGYSLDHCIYPNPKTEKKFGIDRPIMKFNANNYTYGTMTDPHLPDNELKCIFELNVNFC
jgi:hypothetical protein